jgi:GNAT superfamily N-acetyltransferase
VTDRTGRETTAARSPVAIRDATADDAAALEPLFTELGHPTSAEEFRARFARLRAAARPGDRALVAVEAGRVVGLVVTHATPVLHRAKDVGRVTVLVVAPDRQGRGIGRALLATAEEMFRDLGLERVELTSGARRVDAHRFYERYGYAREGVRFARRLDADGG